jgi:hypothetical protein
MARHANQLYGSRMKIAVIGGTGCVGGSTVEALRRAGIDVAIASRRGPLVVDMTRPETFGALADYDIVVDAADATNSTPEALARWCLDEGRTFVEATSDPTVVRRLSALDGGRGRLVLGGGLFTGVSNLLAHEVAGRAPSAPLTLAIAARVLSKAGRGTVALMASMLAIPAARIVDGRRVESPIARGPKIDFAGVRRSTLRVPLAEQEMLAASTGARDVDIFFAPKPSFIGAMFRLLPSWLARRGWFRALMGGSLSLLRRGLLRGRRGPVELVAEAGEHRAVITCDDGMLAAGYALAAIVVELAALAAKPGVFMVDQLVGLEPVLARANALAGRSLLVRA